MLLYLLCFRCSRSSGTRWRQTWGTGQSSWCRWVCMKGGGGVSGAVRGCECAEGLSAWSVVGAAGHPTKSALVCALTVSLSAADMYMLLLLLLCPDSQRARCTLMSLRAARPLAAARSTATPSRATTMWVGCQRTCSSNSLSHSGSCSRTR